MSSVNPNEVIKYRWCIEYKPVSSKYHQLIEVLYIYDDYCCYKHYVDLFMSLDECIIR